MFQKPKRKIHRVFIHCSASDHAHHDNVATMKQWHLARGFSDIGYHFFIQKDGTLEYGRDSEKTPAAQKGHNLNTLAICPAFTDIVKFQQKPVLFSTTEKYLILTSTVHSIKIKTHFSTFTLKQQKICRN